MKPRVTPVQNLSLKKEDLLGTKILINPEHIKEPLLKTLKNVLGADNFIGKGPLYRNAVYFYISHSGHIYYGIEMEKFHRNVNKEIKAELLGFKTTLKDIIGE